MDINNIWEVAEALKTGVVGEELREQVRLRCATDEVYEAQLDEALAMCHNVEDYGRHYQYKTLLQDLRAAHPLGGHETKHIELPKWWKTAAIAASVALLTSTFTVWMFRQQRANTTQYQVLKRELQQVKASQNELKKNIDVISTTPAAQSQFAGTGFAINNNGYLVTNYHVVEGADSLYVQTGKGFYHKAYLVAADQSTDIALLKVYADEFKFSEKEVPYTFSPTKVGLGGKVFTLGYPQDEVVYNEGYISSINGYQGDSMQYRLAMPANPGQSGAPVLDAQGNIVAIITGRATNDGDNATYAVSSKALANLIKSAPMADAITLPKNNRLTRLSREAQLEQMQQYTFMIRVYK